jgi:hypothetical protein
MKSDNLLLEQADEGQICVFLPGKSPNHDLPYPFWNHPNVGQKKSKFFWFES